MIKRKELEAALATAEADCRRANDDFHKAQADRAKANADWDKVVTDRLKGDLDRRKARTVWDQTFPDRRKADADLAALSKAVADRQQAFFAMSDAETEWVKAEAAMSKAEVEWVKAEAKLHMATAKRNEIIAALDELNVLGSKPRSNERIGTRITRLREAAKRGTTPSTYSTGSGERAVRDENEKSRDESVQRKPIHRFNRGFPAQDLSPRHALTRSALLRQTIGLLSLTLAYLQYYYFDIQLQIASLPSIFALPLQ